MKLSDADLHRRSEELELQESQKYNFSPAFTSALEILLLDVYAVLRPRPCDYEHRRHLIHVFDLMAKETYGGGSGFPVVEAFGSSMMDMFTAKCDLDLSINFSADETTSSFPREKKISALRKLARVLYTCQRKGHVYGVVPIMKARVPVVKVVDRGTGIECDISVENKDGMSRSLVIKIISSIDERFQILCFLMKVWAKAHDINSPKDHTLSSLSIVMLVAFHLQTRDPPILPPFSALLKDGSDLATVQNVVHGFKDFGRTNKESLAELFVALLIKLASVKSLWNLGLCASTYDGSWISKTLDDANMSVEDFLDQSQNCARLVGKEELPMIYNCIHGTLDHLSRFMIGQIEASDLQIILFGPAALHNRVEQVIRGEMVTRKRRFPSNDSAADSLNPTLPKRIRFTEPVGIPNQLDISSTTPFLPNLPISLHHPFSPPQPRLGHPGASFDPYEWSYGLPPELPYGSQPHPELHFDTHRLGYGSYQHRPPQVLPEISYGSHHLTRQSFVHPGGPAYSTKYVPPTPFVPPLDQPPTPFVPPLDQFPSEVGLRYPWSY